MPPWKSRWPDQSLSFDDRRKAARRLGHQNRDRITGSLQGARPASALGQDLLERVAVGATVLPFGGGKESSFMAVRIPPARSWVLTSATFVVVWASAGDANAWRITESAAAAAADCHRKSRRFMGCLLRSAILQAGVYGFNRRTHAATLRTDHGTETIKFCSQTGLLGKTGELA